MSKKSKLNILPAFSLLCFVIFLPQKIFTQNKNLHQLFQSYYEERLHLFPIQATFAGDTSYNDLLQNEGSQEFITRLHNFYNRYLDSLSDYKEATLTLTDKLSYKILKDILEKGLENQKYHPEYMPANQF